MHYSRTGPTAEDLPAPACADPSSSSGSIGFPLAAAGGASYVRRMKRALSFVFAVVLLAGSSLRAQTPAAAAAIADKQAEEERYKRLSSQLEDLQAMLTQQAKKIEELASLLSNLRDEQIRREGKSASVDAMKQLVADIQEVDKKRIADNKLIRDELVKIAKAIAETPVSPAGARPKTEVKAEVKLPPATEGAPNAEGKPQKGFEYTVQKDDNLSTISALYRTQGIKVTVNDILKANPGLVPEKMHIGQKIFIPQPGQ